MKSKVRRVVLAYGEAKACQGLWFPVVSSRGRHKWLQPLWLLLWRNLKVGLHMLRVNTGPSALSLTHNWAELTQKHFTTLYSEIDGSLRETRGGYMAITQLQWPVALSRAVLVAAIAHNSTCQRWGRPCFYWNNLSVKSTTHSCQMKGSVASFSVLRCVTVFDTRCFFVILSANRKKEGGGGGRAEGRMRRRCCVFFFIPISTPVFTFKKIYKTEEICDLSPAMILHEMNRKLPCRCHCRESLTGTSRNVLR